MSAKPISGNLICAKPMCIDAFGCRPYIAAYETVYYDHCRRQAPPP
jgi:hypothetical protein